MSVRRLDPVPREQVAELEELFAVVEAGMGFLPNNLLIMARRPELVRAFAGMMGQINFNNDISDELRLMVAYMSSYSAGCQYCQAHTFSDLTRAVGDRAPKLEEIWSYETSELFSEAERAALRVAQGAAQVPNAVTDEDFVALKTHYSDDQVVDIMAVIAAFGFLNRWADTFGTPLEDEPRTLGQERLAKSGWTGAKHA